MQPVKSYKDLDHNAVIKIAQQLAEKPTQIIALKGTLGSGKSFFAKHFINHLQEEETEVLSPSFNIALNYETRIGEIFHFDLYRLKDRGELENIGFFEALKNNICLIEWPEIVLEYLQKQQNFSLIEIDIQPDKLRKITIYQN